MVISKMPIRNPYITSESRNPCAIMLVCEIAFAPRSSSPICVAAVADMHPELMPDALLHILTHIAAAMRAIILIKLGSAVFIIKPVVMSVRIMGVSIID